MKYKATWQMEHMLWANPTDVKTDEDMRAFNEAIGATGMQLQKATDYHVCVWRFEPPAKVLRFIDPVFEPREGTAKFFKQAVKEGRAFAPPQVWCSVTDFADFPNIPWHSDQAQILRKMKAGGLTINDIPREEIHKLVRTHEGRNRLLFAHNLGETLVPVQVWLPRVDPKVASLNRELQETREKLEELQAESGWDERENPEEAWDAEVQDATCASLGLKRINADYYRSKDGRFELCRVDEFEDGKSVSWYWVDTVRYGKPNDLYPTKWQAVVDLAYYMKHDLNMPLKKPRGRS